MTPRTATVGLVSLLALFACATNHTAADLDARMAKADKYSGLIVRLESTGLEMGGLQHVDVPEDGSLIPIMMVNMSRMFSRQQLERIVPALTFYLPADLKAIGYEAHLVETEASVLGDVLESAIAQPRAAVAGAGLAAVRRFAERSGGQLVFLADVRSTHYVSERSHSIATFLGLLAAAGGQYGVAPRDGVAHLKWALIDPSNGDVLRALEDSVREE